MDIYACHGVAGVVGLVFTGVFAQGLSPPATSSNRFLTFDIFLASVTANDGFTAIPGGWLDGNFVQVGIQLCYSVVVWLYVFGMTYAIMFIIDHIPVRLRSLTSVNLF